MRAFSYEEALAKVGYGTFQRKLLLICGLGWAADAMEVLLVSFAMPSMAKEWSLSPAQTGFLATAIFVGMLVGALAWGRLADRIGRNRIRVYSDSVLFVTAINKNPINSFNPITPAVPARVFRAGTRGTAICNTAMAASISISPLFLSGLAQTSAPNRTSQTTSCQ